MTPTKTPAPEHDLVANMRALEVITSRTDGLQ